MSRLIDYTADHLREIAQHAELLRRGDMAIQILATTDGIQVWACAGGLRKTWLSGDVCHWADLAAQRVNPLLVILQGVLFRLQRQYPDEAIVRPDESSQTGA